MKLYSLLKDDLLSKSALLKIEKHDFHIKHFNSVENLYAKSMENPPRVFLIQDDLSSKTQLYDLVKDLREMFGSNPTILMIGASSSSDEISHFIGVGIDYYLSTPFDVDLFDDFLSKTANSDVCRPFRYRGVPSGETPITIEFKVDVNQISNRGISFSSSNYMLKGSDLKLSILSFIPLITSEIKVKILQSSVIEEGFEYFAEYVELGDELRKQISHEIKNIKK
jgi:hypothetical protein